MTIDVVGHLDYWEQRIGRDLTPFVDPGTTLHLTREGRVVHATWVQRSQTRSAAFSISMDAGVHVTFRERTLPYKSFFAASDIGDLLGLAKMILQSQSAGVFVPTKARRNDTPSAQADDAITVLKAAMTDPWTEDATLVLMVTGEAGAGKTSVLQRLVADQANAYVRGATECLYLYVNAQGRALARFNEALATELQDLRALLTYHGVSTLVRLGILVPIIDGFDELLGVGGYDDAFSSLASFIEELDGGGKLIASARSTYYEHEFVARANRASALGSQVWKQIPVEVLAWGDAELDQYLEQRCLAAALSPARVVDVSSRVRRVFRGQNESLRHKPLFVARTMDLVLADVDLSGEGDLLEKLVSAYIERERTEKLLLRSGDPILTAVQLRTLMGELSEEMWNQETRELDPRSVREVAEYVTVTLGVDESIQKVVSERMASVAFLTPGTRTGGVAFEHETFFAYFLAQRFAAALALGNTFPPLLLGRAILPADLPAIMARVLNDKYSDLSLQQALDRLGASGLQASVRTVQVRENAGALVSTLLKERCDQPSGCEGLTVRHITIPGGDWGGVRLIGARLEDVVFRRVDLSHTVLSRCEARGVVFMEPLVDPTVTRLELSGLDVASQVLGIRATEGDEVRLLFEPEQVDRLLIAVGAALPRPSGDAKLRNVEDQVLDVLRRFVRAYNRSNPVCTSDDNLTSVFKHRAWPDIQRLLVSSGVVSEESRHTGGPSKTFLRRHVLAEQILSGLRLDADVPTSVGRFWIELERAFPSTRKSGSHV